MKKLTHIDEKGKAQMVNISEKKIQARYARASGQITLNPETIKLIRTNQVKKGDVLTVSEIAGIQAAKKTAELIPLCHNILLNQVIVHAKVDESGVVVESEVHSTGTTGAEMEALTAVNIALLTIYDMCKATDKAMVIKNIKLLKKSKTDIEIKK